MSLSPGAYAQLTAEAETEAETETGTGAGAAGGDTAAVTAGGERRRRLSRFALRLLSQGGDAIVTDGGANSTGRSTGLPFNESFNAVIVSSLAGRKKTWGEANSTLADHVLGSIGPCSFDPRRITTAMQRAASEPNASGVVANFGSPGDIAFGLPADPWQPYGGLVVSMPLVLLGVFCVGFLASSVGGICPNDD